MQRQIVFLAAGIVLVLVSGVVYIIMAVQQVGTNDLSSSFEGMEQRRLAPGIDRPLLEQFIPFIFPFVLGVGVVSLFFMTDTHAQA